MPVVFKEDYLSRIGVPKGATLSNYVCDYDIEKKNGDSVVVLLMCDGVSKKPAIKIHNEELKEYIKDENKKESILFLTNQLYHRLGHTPKYKLDIRKCFYDAVAEKWSNYKVIRDLELR
ncbi:MAG: hypothetical protein DRN95_02675 [Candidatus Hydrothermarchaeota archaeon]|nr:MAG: hypothetical protein DRN95_02675 [Candidatus Hydrothermarchaeota archaeon]